MKTLAELAQEALNVQDACNLSGVAHGFARVMSALCARVPGTDRRNTHPIAIVWADKIAHLTGTQPLGGTPFRTTMAAHRVVQDMADGNGCRQCGEQELPAGCTVTCGRSECQEAEARDNAERATS